MPYTVDFENGISVDFDNEPTASDIEEVSKSLNFQATPQNAKKPSLLERVDKATSKVFEPVSNALFGTTASVVGGLGGAFVEGIQGKDGVFTKGLQKQLATPGSAAKTIGLTALELFPGGQVGKAKALGGVSKALKESSIQQYTRALAPTTKEMKLKSAKVVPELLNRGVTALSRKSLASKAGEGLSKAGEALETALENIKPKTPLSVGPVLKALQESKKAFMVPGKKVIAEPKAIQAIEQIEGVVKELGPKVSFESLRGLRQIWDKSVAKSKGFLMDEASNFSVMAKREASNAIRKEIAKKFPDLAKVNAEYSFWKNVDDVIGSTVQRTAGQGSGLADKVATAAGAASGLVRGGVSQAAQTALVFNALSKAINSTAWKTFSAVQKNKLADSLAKGSFGNALVLLSKGVSPAVRGLETE